MEVTAAATNLLAGVGPRGERIRRLGAVAQLFSLLKCGWVVLADRNRTPAELVTTRFIEQVSGRVVLPESTEATCTAGKGKAA